MYESPEHALMGKAKSDRVGYLAGKAKLVLEDNSRLYSSKTKNILKKSYCELPDNSPLKGKVHRHIVEPEPLAEMKIGRVLENHTGSGLGAGRKT